MLRKLPIVGVFGQGTPIAADQATLAREVGALVARMGAHLLTGGGFGVMEAAAEGFVAVQERAGLSIGIVPRDPNGPVDVPHRDINGNLYPNPFIEIAVMTGLPPMAADPHGTPGRNHINVLTADAIIALAGNHGTRNELDLTASYYGETGRLREQRRAVLIGPAERFAAKHLALFVHVTELGDAEAHVRRVLKARGFDLGAAS